MTRIFLISTAISGLVLASCGDRSAQAPTAERSTETPAASTPEVITKPAAEMLSATFDVVNAGGNTIGTVKIEDTMSGVNVMLDVTSIPEGNHAIHFHENGTCDGPDFTSAGGHYNPKAVMHGFDTDTGPHAGDMKNFDTDVSGVVKKTIENSRVSLSDREGLSPLYDSNGTALIIHAEADDYKSQPSGAAGSRIACAVIAN